jgi:putative hemolysin
MHSLERFFSQFLIILLLTIFNGLFSMAEMAVVSARKVRLQQRAEDGDEKAKAALDLVESPNRFLSTVQVGITLIGTLSGALGGAGPTAELESLLIQVPVLAPYAHAIAIGLVVLLVTYLSLVVGELVPKRLAMANPEGIAGVVAGPMGFLSKAVKPVIWLLSISTEGLLRLLGAKSSDDAPVTPEEITVMMEQGEQVGVFEETETSIVEAVFRLSDLRVGALMTPRTDLDWLDLEEPYDDILKQVLESPHNHFPVANGSLDDVVGILRSKDLLARTTDGVEIDLKSLLQPAQFIPESLPAFQALNILKGAFGNLALVMDEYGGLQGMVTLFDVMEAIVGDISERGEPVVPEAVQREDGSWLVEGMMRIDELKGLLDIDAFPEEDRAGYQTVGGFIMTQIGAVPNPGDFFTIGDWRFEVMDMDGMRVDKVLASRVP